MKLTTLIMAAGLLAGAPAGAQVEVVSGPDGTPPPLSAEAAATARPGDDALSCRAINLEAEAASARIQVAVAGLNAASGQMSADMLAQQQQMAARIGGGGLGMTAAGVVSSFIPGAGLALGLAQSAASAAPSADQREQQARNQQRAHEMQSAATALQDVAPLGYRLEYLAHLARTKGC